MDQGNSSVLFYGGLSGLVLPVPKYQFPPPYQDASRLTYYASFFNSIEINSSFYKIPQPATIKKWEALVPDYFKFTFKLWREITHNKEFHFQKSDVERFFHSINNIGDKKGCLLIQFPPSAGIDHKHKLSDLLQCIKEIDPEKQWRIAVEFRHKSWYDDVIYDLVDTHEATIVIQDIPKSATPMLDLLSDTIYVRFHGPTGNYRGSYSDDILSEYAGYISEWADEGKKVFLYFNNTMGDAFKNLQSLITLVSRE